MSQIVCSVHNNKGGIGKTTVTVLLASALCYECGMKVMVLDSDSSQNSTFTKRESELMHYKEALELYENPETRTQIESFQRNRIKDNLEKGIGIKDFFKIQRVTTEMIPKIDFAQLPYDIIFLDLGAKMEKEFFSILNRLDLLMIPFQTKNYELESSITYTELLATLKSNGTLPARLRIRPFWNKIKMYSGPQCDNAEEYLSPLLAGIDISFFKTRLYEAETGFGSKKLNSSYSSPFAALEEKDLMTLKNAGTTLAENKERQYYVRVREFINETVDTIQEILDEKANG